MRIGLSISNLDEPPGGVLHSCSGWAEGKITSADLLLSDEEFYERYLKPLFRAAREEFMYQQETASNAVDPQTSQTPSE